MHDTLEARPTFCPCQILALEFKKYVLLTTYSMLVCQTLKQLSQIFERVGMLLQATGQLCFPKWRFVVVGSLFHWSSLYLN